MPELKKGLWHRCFPMNFVKYLRILFFIEHLWTTNSGLCDSWLLLDFCQFFPNSTLLIMKPCSKSTAEKQGKIWWLVARCSWLVVGFVGASSFGCFLGGFGWFLLVEDNFGWLQVVCYFSSYTDFTVYRRVISLLHS